MNRDTHTDTTQTPQDSELAGVLEHAQELSDSSAAPSRLDWSYAAAHVGDLSVLALAFRT